MKSNNHFKEVKQPHTKAKHLLLKEYFGAWLGIITKQSKGRTRCLFYVDVCAGTGKFRNALDGSQDILNNFGSPIIALDEVSKAIQSNVHPTENINFKFLLFDNNNDNYQNLIETIKDFPYDEEKIKFETYDGSFHEELEYLVGILTKQNHFSFINIDPYNLSSIPLEVVTTLVSIYRADSVVFFPFDELVRELGYLESEKVKSKENLTANLNAYFGTSEWKQWTNPELSATENAKLLFQKYRQIIQEKSNKYCLNIEFLKPDKHRTHIGNLICTKSPMGAIDAKERIAVLEPYQNFLRAYYKESMTGQQNLFGSEDIKGNIYRVSKQIIAEEIINVFSNQSISGGKIISYFLDQPGVFRGNLSSAIVLLQKQKKLHMNTDKLKESSIISIK